jgi:hypothetical protein
MRKSLQDISEGKVADSSAKSKCYEDAKKEFELDIQTGNAVICQAGVDWEVGKVGNFESYRR